MTETVNNSASQEAAEQAVQIIQDERGPFVVAAETTRMPMLFTDAKSTENNIVFANKSFMSLTGYDEGELKGLPFHCLLANEADRDRATPQTIAEIDSSTLDLRCMRRDRSSFDAAVLVSPVRDKAGKLQQYFVGVLDLTKQVDDRLRDHLQEADIFRHAPGFIAFSEGPNHCFTFTNHAFEILAGRCDLVGRRVSDAFPELVGQQFVELLDRVYNSGERLVGRHAPIRLARGPKGESEKRYIDFIYEAVRNASGTVVGLFCEGSDVTDARAVSQQLREAQAQLMHVSRVNAMGAMAETLAHELNQPLAAIANYASGCIHLIEQTGVSSGKLHNGLFAITAASERAGKVISRLRGMTKRTTSINEIFDLSHALEESVQLVRAGGCNNVAITTQCTPSLMVQGDEIQVQQVLINLLRNACDAAAQSNRTGAVLAMSMRRTGRPSVVVRDNGPGLSGAMQADVFKWTESTKVDGMGIGLSISRTIAENHGGHICVDESGPSGTSFSFSLPSLPLGKTRNIFTTLTQM